MQVRISNLRLFLLVIVLIASKNSLAQDTITSVDYGLRLAKDKQYQQAISVFDRCVKSYPLNPNVYFYLGNAYLDLMQFEKAAEKFSRTIFYDTAYTDA